MCYQKTGDRKNVCKSDLGKKGHCNITTWVMTPMTALLLHHGTAVIMMI